MSVFLLALISSVAALCALLVGRWSRVRSYWSARGIAADPPHPIFGSLTFIQRRNFVEWLNEQYLKHKGLPYFGMWLFWRPVLVVRSPDIAKRILVKDFDNFRNRLLKSGETDPLGGLNVFTIMDPHWSPLRKSLAAFFSSAKLKALHPLMLAKSRELVQRIRNENRSGNHSHLRDIFACYTTDVISASAFGVAGDATLTNQSPMRVVSQDLMEFTLWRGMSWCSIFFFPELVDWFKFKMYPHSSIEYFRRIFDSVVEDRKKMPEDAEQRDLIGILLKMKRDAAKEGKELSDDFLVAQSAIMLLGGFDTTALTLTWCLYELAFRPDAQERLYQEILETRRKLNGEEFTPKVLREMVYLNAVLKETIRKYPPMGWLDRMAAHDYQVDDSLTIPAGTIVYISASGMQLDPEYFEHPEDFDPDRFLPENQGKIVPFTYMPFGEGPRQCIGERFGKQSASYALVSVVENFRAVPLAGAPAPGKVKLDCRGIFQAPGEYLHVQFVPRE